MDIGRRAEGAVGWVLCGVLVLIAAACRGPAGKATPRDAIGPAVNANELGRTVVTAHLDRDIPAGKNLLWCATFQMTWDELKTMAGGQFQVIPRCDLAEKLNRAAIGANDIPKDGTISIAGLVSDGVLEEIATRLSKIHKGRPGSSLLPRRSDLPEDGVVAYAHLLRSMRFPTPFSRLRARRFRTGSTRNAEAGTSDKKPRVALFGIDDLSPSNQRETAQARQVRILWHRFVMNGVFIESREYVVELLTNSAEDRLLLAKIMPAQTLRETVNQVLERIKQPNSKTLTDERKLPPELRALRTLWGQSPQGPDAQAHDRILKSISAYSCLLFDEALRVPLVRLDITKNYSDLLGRKVICPNPDLNDKPIVQADQRIRFGLDEKGAELESEAVTVVFGSAAMRDFSFTDPFLIILMRKGAANPYFALWIANDELLCR